MSWWTHTRGIIVIDCVYGRTQLFRNNVMNEIIKHAPFVTGSEGNLEIKVVRDPGYNMSFYEKVFDEKEQKEKYFRCNSQSRYSLILNGDFGDRMFDETKDELESLLDYLSRRLLVDTCYVEVYEDFVQHKLYTRDSILSNHELALKYLGSYDSDCAVNAVKELDLFESQSYVDMLYKNCDPEDVL